MKRSIVFCLLSYLLAIGGATLFAQTGGEGGTPPPKVLVVTREFLKPGKAGSPHEKTESTFVQAMAAAKWPTHYIGTDAVTGPSRSVFFTPYDSLDAWEKDTKATLGNPTLAAALDRASIADGDLLSSIETNVFHLREDLSYNADKVNVGQMRYFEPTTFKVRPGHEMEWEGIAKMYVENFGKAVPDAHWATYEEIYGHDSGGVYVVLVPYKSLAEVDASFSNAKKFMEQMGESGMKRIMEMSASSTESIESNLLMFNPKLSYPSEKLVEADPGFWKPKAAAAPPK